jgi:hypothetical protein
MAASRFAKFFAIVGATMFFSGALHATGYYGPEVYLDHGGKNVDGSPEFYWGLEVRRICREFHPTERLILSEQAKSETNEEKADEDSAKKKPDATTEADLKDFEAALSENRIKAPNAAQAKAQHKAAREALDAATVGTPVTLPAEFDSEFADYHKGAAAYLAQDWNGARTAWENLLKRPEQDRHYRTVWAAFMIGKAALKAEDYPNATQWFERTRELAKQGFADSLGLAGASYGWQGRSEWKQDHPEKAAPLFLTQLALGDASAVVSLKALIPDREPVDGMLNYGPEPDERSGWDEEQKRAEEQKGLAKLKAAGQDPLLRRLVTVHILAAATANGYFSEEEKAAAAKRCARWLDIIKKTNAGPVEDAEYLGWVAYNNGDYKGAERWLGLSKSESGAALWLRAKLQRRAGKISDAANTMAKAWENLMHSSGYNEPEGMHERMGRYENFPDGPHWGWGQSSSGDLASLRLVRGDFVQSLDTFIKGHLWNDAAFVAERVLIANELKQYVDAQPATAPPKEGEDDNAKLRYLLGRRLVREDRYAEAKAYLSPPYDKVLEKYVKALGDGANEKLPKTDRAHAFFTAAWIARHNGMELMGTEAAPDAFVDSGEFELPDIAKQRRSGVYQTVSYENGDEKKKSSPVVLKASPKELQRLSANKIEPDVRFHYRSIAGALAIKAAALLPDNSEELADVVNQAGVWVKDRDEKTANRYYQIIERRCPNTDIARADRSKHWFVDQEGPWSKAEAEAFEAFEKQIRPTDSEPTPTPTISPAP